ncbi:MAG: RNA methyltransferase [Chlamydiae bacterium]|nr:RNA methyltransferase [Chlamydiota bacterium]
MLEITSFSNPKIKQIIKLRDKNERDATDLFLIEGYRELLRSLGHVQITQLFFCEDFFLKENEFDLIEKIKNKNVEIFKCEKRVFEKISYRDRPDGLLAVAKQVHLDISVLEKIVKQKPNPFFVICERIEKPGNLGTILRSADGAGADAVVVCDPVTDIFNPNVVRSSTGALFTQKVITLPKQIIFDFLKKQKIQIVAASPHAKEIFTDVDLTKSLAIIVGAEQYGLSALWMENSDVLVKIPMMGDADSLNVAQATTLLLYEVQRQRRNSILR